MKREYFRWYSHRLGRDMELLVFGHAGARVLMFPTREGRFWEYESLGIIDSMADKIEAGQLQLFCVEGLAGETLYGSWMWPADRIHRYNVYEDYILHEVLPFTTSLNPHGCLIAQGCSLGAFQAVDLVFRHPHLFTKMVAFSGRYDLTLEVESFRDLFDGHYDDEIYFHMPSHFLPGLACEKRLAQLRRIDMVFTIGEADPFLENNHRLSRTLHEKGINHQMHVWDGRAHRASAWRRMAPLYI